MILDDRLLLIQQKDLIIVLQMHLFLHGLEKPNGYFLFRVIVPACLNHYIHGHSYITEFTHFFSRNFCRVKKW